MAEMSDTDVYTVFKAKETKVDYKDDPLYKQFTLKHRVLYPLIQELDTGELSYGQTGQGQVCGLF